MKTQDELNAKEEVKALKEKSHELTEEELAQVTGGGLDIVIIPKDGFEFHDGDDL